MSGKWCCVFGVDKVCPAFTSSYATCYIPNRCRQVQIGCLCIPTSTNRSSMRVCLCEFERWIWYDKWTWPVPTADKHDKQALYPMCVCKFKIILHNTNQNTFMTHAVCRLWHFGIYTYILYLQHPKASKANRIHFLMSTFCPESSER